METTTVVRERPILMSQHTIPGLLDGSKTMTRRIIKPQPTMQTNGVWLGRGKNCAFGFSEAIAQEMYNRNGHCPYGEVGGILWVRETWAEGFDASDGSPAIAYKEDCPEQYRQFEGWKSPIYMPKYASRIRLEITAVRVERLNAITEDDAFLEGVTPRETYCYIPGEAVMQPDAVISAREVYELLWNKINGKDSWSSNPWVWVISFRIL